MSKWYVYIINTKNGLLYTGITNNLERRVKEHSDSSKKGAKFFRLDKPKELLFFKEYKNRSGASKAEYAIKKLKRVEKLELIKSDQNEKK